jgi:serine/threonine protein kinase
MAPEGWRLVLDARSDLWAFGMTLYQVLTGHLPFDVTDEQEIQETITSLAPLDLGDLPGSAPEAVVRIVARCLQKDPSKRHHSAAELRRDLESALAYLESGQADVAAVPLCPGSTILLNVEYREPGIQGQYREYRILEEVGRGSFSVVYRATDVIGKRQVALKILRQERMNDERVLARFRREAGLLARLRHPNIVQGHNFGQYIADFFIVMEILSGVTLQDALACGFQFAVPHAVAVVAQVLAGLERIHAEGAVHRDLKPANVMLQPQRAVVMDMGFARVDGGEGLTVSGEIFGTPRYMAPEQARGEKATLHSDLYAAGVVLYELLTGRIPHEADSTASLLFAIALEEPEPITNHRRDLPSALVSFLDRMLARESGSRFQSARLAYGELLASVGLQGGDLAAAHGEMFSELRATISQ